MSTDLALDDQRYALCLSIFFVGYLIMEVPSNMILSRSRPSIFLPAIMLVWGALSAAMGATPSYGGLIAFRFVLGCVESGTATSVDIMYERPTLTSFERNRVFPRSTILAQLLVQAI